MTITAIQIAPDPGVDNCLIDFGSAGVDKVEQWLAAKRCAAALIGAGGRLASANTLLFEAVAR